MLVLAYLLYLFLGATVFSAIEHPIERKMLQDLEDQKAEFLGKNKCIKGQTFRKHVIHLKNMTLSCLKLMNDNHFFREGS